MTHSQKDMKPAKKKSSGSNRPSSVAAVKPFVTQLYEGTAELRIVIPKTSRKQHAELNAGTYLWPEPRECYEIILPQVGPHATENDCVVALISSLTDVLLKDIESAKGMTRKAAQAEGISRAKAEGKRFGRQSLALDEELFEKLCRAYADNTITPERKPEKSLDVPTGHSCADTPRERTNFRTSPKSMHRKEQSVLRRTNLPLATK